MRGWRGVGARLWTALTRYSRKARLSETMVADRLYVGGSYAPESSSLLTGWGIGATVNMRTRPESLSGAETLHLPTKDRHAPSLEDLERGTAFIRRHIKAGRKVYVHCRQGIGRGPTMAVAYLISTGMPFEEALALVRSRRPYARPNRRQRERLREFEQARKK